MNLKTIGQLAGAVLLTVGLAGCMDVEMELEVLSETTGKTTTVMTMGADFYAMAKAGMAAPPADGAAAPAQDGFCTAEGEVLVENADGSATCTTVKEGTLAELSQSDDGGGKFAVVSPGVVKVTFSTAEMQGEMGTEQDEETKAMMVALFEGKTVTIRVRGKKISDTNMTLSADGTTAETVIPFLDLINGNTNLPAELYATVDTN